MVGRVEGHVPGRSTSGPDKLLKVDGASTSLLLGAEHGSSLFCARAFRLIGVKGMAASIVEGVELLVSPGRLRARYWT
jgi:hypothetical protein